MTTKDDIRYIFQLGELFEQVQMQQVFKDSKTFVDCTPLAPLAYIQSRYREVKDSPEFDLSAFVKKYFKEPETEDPDFKTDKNISITDHIRKLWDHLTREAKVSGSSLITLPKPYVVPGGRFRELFYWDSYFTMLGLQINNRYDLIEDMIINFTSLLKIYGYIPNGNRTYFLGRSQPPFYALMLQLLADKKGPSVLADHLQPMMREYDFWMQGEENLSPENNSINRVALLEEEDILNHYWDKNNTPRPEAYKKDMEWVQDIEDREIFFRNERAACESGWDFSSRWFADGKNIDTNRAADLIAVDLNCLLWNLENTIAETADKTGDEDLSERFHEKAEGRKILIEKYCWDENLKFYVDYDYNLGESSKEISLAAGYPLFFRLCNPQQAANVAKVLEEKFLKEGGLLTTLTESGQQWDAPNGWAPLQWIAIRGLANYGHNKLAKEIAQRWMHSNETIFQHSGKLMEKYNVETKEVKAGGGTYPTQDGFGWTNGVYLACKQLLADI